MNLRFVGVSLLVLGLVACNNPPLPRYQAALGTYTVKEGDKDKLGIALFSSFDPAFPIPQNQFEIQVLGPRGLRANHVFLHPSKIKSDWFADPDLEVLDGTYAVVATIGDRQHRLTTALDPDSFLEYPEVELEETSDDQIAVSWNPVEDSKVYYVTLNQKVPGSTKPLVVRELYTEDLEASFENLDLKVNLPYFVAVGALSLDPRIPHSRLSEPFNVSYGQTQEDILVDAAGKMQILK